VDGTEVSVTMDTGVRLLADLDLAGRRLDGHLVYPDGSEREAELPWSPRDAFAGLQALDRVEIPFTYAAPRDRGDGWPLASADEVGVDSHALEAVVASVVRGEAGVLHSLLVARHGRLVLEEYFHGYGPDDLHPLRSCTKSISSLLVGQAIREGAIRDVRVPLASFFADDADLFGEGWDALTLEDLLTMSMALDWTPQEAENLHGTGPEFFRRILSRRVVGAPGQDFAYVNANVNLLAGILHRTTGMQAESLAARTLFGPLGISTWDWDGMKTDGFNLMDGSLRLRPRDMAKIGQMVLGHGGWNGEQVVDPRWIQASTRRHLDAGPGGEGYGYLWWLMEAPVPGRQPVSAVFANGWGSQFIILFPSLDLVVVTTGGNDYNGKHMAVAETIGRDLIPGVAPDNN
jgi:CubicO group peptidase (beta-lactamase class C family)